jgi:hypothetical protein
MILHNSADMAEKDDVLDTTIVRQGAEAETFLDMTLFVESIEQRPLDKLLGDLPGLAKLSRAKFNLARHVVQRRIRELNEVEREQLRLFADDVARAIDEGDAERIRSVFVQQSTA